MTIEDISLEHIYEFMERGSMHDAPQAIVDYLDRLDKIRSMFNRIDKFGSKEAIVKHLMLVDGMSRYKANKACDECREYFHSETTISKSAWRNIIAEKMDKVINFSLMTMKDVGDGAKIIKMLAEYADMRGVNLPDKEELPESLFTPPFVIYSTDAKFLGMPEPNRNKISEMVDNYAGLTEKEKIRLKQDALIIPLNVFDNE